jgi:translation initiation factor IF-2
MEKITVAELAKECAVQNQVVLAELKRLGLYVFSSTATIDTGFAETIRKKIYSQREAEEAKVLEAEKKKEALAEAAKKAASKSKKAAPAQTDGEEAAAPKAAAPAAPAAPRAKKAVKKPEKVEPKKEEEPVAPKLSLAPRKGRKHYDRGTSELVETAAPSVAAKPAELSPSEVAQAFLADVGVAPTEAQPGEEAHPADSEAPAAAAPASPEAAGSEAAPKPEEPAAPQAPPPKRIVLPKAKILMRTSPDTKPLGASDRILRVVPPPGRPYMPTRLIRKRKPGRPDQPDRGVAKVIELPRPPESPEDFKPIAITEGVTLKELAEKMDIKSKYIIQKLIAKGILASINQTLDIEIAREVCAEFGFRADVISFEQEAEARQETADDPQDRQQRPPVVTIMGHVDHGKTSLLDAIREAQVAASEAGGITQHIGAYHVEIKGRNIVFLDTPGHEAFTLMRARGAQVTDIVVLVVAADDGVMPQTVEAIHHAKAAGVPLLVAINKIDKPGAQPERVKQALSDHGLVAEDWGGDVVTVPVSAKMKTNLDLLLEMILLVADLKELRANPKRLAAGVVLEAKVDTGRGRVATVLVQNGTLRVGDSFVAGAVHGRVRALVNDRGKTITDAGPSMPVEIQGLQDLPQAGDSFQVFEDANKARQVAEYRQIRIREQALRTTARLSLQALYSAMKQGSMKELPLIIKADVQGSVEVLTEVLNKLSTEKVKVRVLHSGAGAVTETDVLLASASNAIIIGFNVRPERKAQDLADSEGVEIRMYTVIYNVANDIKNAMIGMLEHTTREKYLGRAEVRDTFRVPRYGFVAGSYILDGTIKRNSAVRLLRDNVVIHEGKVGSLRRFKEDVSEVTSGFECGIGFEHFSDVKVGDIIEAYVTEKVQPTSL